MRSSRDKLKLLRSLRPPPPSTAPAPPASFSNHSHSTPDHHHSITNSNLRSCRNKNNHTAKLIHTSNLTFIPPETQTAHTLTLTQTGRKMEPELAPEIRIKAFNICRDYLHGTWKQIDLRDIILKRVSGGLSNYLYHCSLPLTLSPIGNEPSEVLLRFYGQVHGEDALESLITESVIFALLSERKLGPKLYGIFPGGRIEQFLPARPLLTDELRDPKLSLMISKKLAQIHSLNIPISKEASWLWGTMNRWMKSIRENLPQATHANERQKEIIGCISIDSLTEELTWLKEFLIGIDSPVVFAHNDLQEGNILLRPEYESMDDIDKLVLIDFEYCSYNYRGFDLANHFCEWTFNYNVGEYPNFKYTPEDYPSYDERIRFIRNYIDILRKETEGNFPELTKDFYEASKLFNEEHVLKEVKAFTLASHFFWTLWAIVNAQISKIPFGYWDYGYSRFQTYFKLKENILKNQ